MTSSSFAFEKIQLTIRCAMQAFSDYPLECPVDWTVSQLKEYLAEFCPTKPEVGNQRLIYAGRCLENGQKIIDVIQSRRDGMPREDNEQLERQVIHLVNMGKQQGTAASVPQQGEVRRRTNANAGNASAASNQNEPSSAGVFNINQNYLHSPLQFPAASELHQNYDSWMAAYQNYMNYMAQFYQPQHQMATPFQMPTNVQNPYFGQFLQNRAYLVAHNQHPHFLAHPQQPVNNAMGLPMADQQVPVLQAVNVNGPINNAGAGARQVAPDLLDIVYKSVRFALLAIILFMYSSLERFFFVVCIIALFWFVQLRRGNGARAPQEQEAGRQGQGRQPPNQERANIGAQGQDEDTNRREAHNQQEEAGEGTDGAGEPSPVRANPDSPSVGASTAWNVFWSTVQSFFTSLIPENPAPLDIN